jgi:5-methylcytosine-specific restriction endonuclease McrA
VSFKRKPIDLKTREGRQKFYQTREWRTLRLVKLTESPWCEECKKEGLNTLATEVDHITDISQAPTRFMDITNLQSLCKQHHSAKTFQEHREGSKFGKKKEFQVVNLKWK